MFIYILCIIITITLKDKDVTDLCNEDLQTTITLFKHTASSHKSVWTFTNLLPAMPCRLYGTINTLINVLEGECSPSRNLCKYKHRYLHSLLLFVYFVYIYPYSVVCGFMFTCLPFFMLVFIVILSHTIICKQVCLLHCFAFAVLVQNFNVKQCKGNRPVSGFFIFITNSI